MQFAQHAANAIERAKLNREMVLRMVEISELRDPYETGQHAKRVSTYSTEIFSVWAERRDISTSLIRATKEALMPAAMLHDVGKVAVSDVILKKPALLTNDEKRLMKLHTVYGARLFKNLDSHWDRVAHEVVLNHHEWWNGQGYPGKIANILEDPVQFGPGRSGEEIPVTARIVTIADVFDALISDRAYKEAWNETSVLEYIEKQVGKQFDPEIVEIFLGMQPVIRSIRERYSY
jgi:HD-GYP domain-containing protein (c-di-GMP phosphodiesterase class II)